MFCERLSSVVVVWTPQWLTQSTCPIRAVLSTEMTIQLQEQQGLWVGGFTTVTSWWARWRLKSPASRLFTQPFIQTQIRENINVTCRCAGNSPGTGEFPAQMASNAEKVSNWWHRAYQFHLCVIFAIQSLYWSYGHIIALILIASEDDHKNYWIIFCSTKNYTLREIGQAETETWVQRM